jgi:hypothetical protein
MRSILTITRVLHTLTAISLGSLFPITGVAPASDTREWDNTFPKSDKVIQEKVSFHNRYGITVAAEMKYLFSFAVVSLMSFTFVVCSQAQASDISPKHSTKDSVRITLTIGNKVIPAILYNNPPAKNLMARLPVTVFLNRGPIEYCGGIDIINYGKDDVQTGYHNGNLAYWIPGQDFVIFTEKEETSSKVSDLVIIGQISTDIREVRDLGSTIKVTIAMGR